MTTGDLKELLDRLRVHNYADTNRDVYQLAEEAIRHAERLEAENKRLRDNLFSAIIGVLSDLRKADRLRYGFDWPGLLPIAQKIIERAELEGVRNDRD